MCDVVPALSLKLTNHNRPRERSSLFPGVLSEIQAPQHLALGVVYVARLEVEKMEKKLIMMFSRNNTRSVISD